MNDIVFTEFTSEINCKLNEPITLYFFGDVHRDSERCNVKRWNRFRHSAQAEKGNVYFFGLGDYGDMASTSERKALQTIDSKIHDETREKLDYVIERNNRLFAREVMFMKGRLLGMIDGNHTWQFLNGKNATEDLCERLGANYLGGLSYYSLRFNINGTNRSTIDIIMFHGKAGGKLVGTSINQVDDLRKIFPAADIYVMGHDHQLYAYPSDVLIKKDGVIKQHVQFLCRSGSFKKGYVPGMAGYEVKRLLRPSHLGALKLIITFHQVTGDASKRHIIHDINAVI